MALGTSLCLHKASPKMDVVLALLFLWIESPGQFLPTDHRSFQDRFCWEANRMRVWGVGGNFHVLLILITVSRWKGQYLILFVLVILFHVRFRFKSCQQRKSSALLKLSGTSFFFQCPLLQTQPQCPYLGKIPSIVVSKGVRDQDQTFC